MGHSSERYDLISYETHAGMWIAYRQQYFVNMQDVRQGTGVHLPGQSRRSLGRRMNSGSSFHGVSILKKANSGVKEHFLSPYREGEKLTIDEYYRFIFESVFLGFPKKRPKRI